MIPIVHWNTSVKMAVAFPVVDPRPIVHQTGVVSRTSASIRALCQERVDKMRLAHLPIMWQCVIVPQEPAVIRMWPVTKYRPNVE